MNLLVLFAPSRLLKPILDRAGVKPRIVVTRPNKSPRSRKVVVDEDEPGLVAAKKSRK